MQLIQIDQPLVFYFPVVSAGALVTGLLAGAFTVTVEAPDGTLLSPVPAVSQSTKPGVYQFTVPSSFWAAHGAGMYIATIEVGAPGPTTVFWDNIQVVDLGAEVGLSVTFDAAANTLRAHAWLATSLGQKLAGLSNATLQLFDRTGTALTTLATTPTPDAQSVFAFNVPAPAFLVGETETYFVVAIQDAGLPARTWRTVVGATFSRTS